MNAIACENSLPGTDPSVWDIAGAGDDAIQGFSTDISVDAGNTIGFKIKTAASSYGIAVYRLGYYGGLGARFIQNITPSATLPQIQPACVTDTATLNYDCGNWALSASWAVPSSAVSGVYIATLSTPDGAASQISFVVRNDSSTSRAIFQTSDEAWEAYNTYGGSDFYVGTTSLTGSQARAFKVSYNRPFATRGLASGRDFLFSNEYPTIRFMEQNGYDVSYMAGVDTDRYGASLLKNHKVFLSVGHDEYWSQQQRTNVENARDNNGLNLMFLSGNEVYWRTRFENSIDGANTSYRTLVCYKDTWDNSVIDSSGTATATWRDPRFSNAPSGTNPENGLTGTAYMANSDDLAITVSQREGKLRIWRGTSLATMSTASTALAPHTVGYESDEDLDNGYRPAGLIDVSTTTGSTPQYLTDFGSTVVPGTTTHHLTMYRAASGALVFGAGSIQWGWGLDATHDGNADNTPADSRIRQATMNVLADMGVQPTTRAADLVATTASSDTSAPTSAITSPAASASIANGTSVTVTGTAADTGGGVVAGVEVSLDGGKTWHPATGTTSWTYTGILHGNGPSTIMSRASDDSVNLQQPSTSVSVSVSCPCSVFGAAVPNTADAADASAVEVGMRFTSDTDGYVSGVRFYKAAANTGTHVGTLWSAGGTALASGIFSNETASGWQTLMFAAPVAVNADTTYVVSYSAPNGHYSADSRFFYYKTLDAVPLHAPATSPDKSTVNGVFSSTLHAFPTSTYQGGNYYVDALFTPSSSVAPMVTGQSPSGNASSVATSSAVTATFSKSMNASSIGISVTKTATGAVIAGATSYSASTKTATFVPTSALDYGTQFSVTVTGSDTSGLPLAVPYHWTFTTAYAGQVGGSCPCSLYPDTKVPTTVTANDQSSVELGVKFTADTDGVVTGMRFYKGSQNLGIHTGSLWNAAGTQLATGTFTNETSTGWQTLTFTSAVPVTGGATYVVSYHATAGSYSDTVDGHATAVDNFPLHSPAGGGVYLYGTGFPANASTVDYSVDVVFTVPASTVPAIASTSPSNGGTIFANSPVSAAFNTSVLAGTPTVTVTGASGAVSGTTTLDAVHKVLTFTPSASWTTGGSYSVSINGARSLSGTPQSAAASFGFTVAGGSATNCPCTVFAATAAPAVADSGDGSSVTLGTQFIPSVSGFVTGVKFYKSAANTGVHTGSIWSSAGVRLATATFTSETASGWQSVSFSSPVAVSANATYVVGYYAPLGHYASTAQYFASVYSTGPLAVPAGNGLFVYGSDALPTGSYNNSNYWVDVVFTPPSPPAITAVAAAVSGRTAAITWTTDKAASTQVIYGVSPTALTSSVSGPASVTAHSATLSGLANGTTYYYRVVSADAAGNSATSPSTSAAAGTFAIADTIAPVVTAVVANPSSTSTVISWTTDEASSTRVDYGTSPGSLTLNSTVSTMTTAHSVTLSGMSSSTPYYYYRVTSADAAGNSTTAPATTGSPANFAPGVVALTVGSTVAFQAVDNPDTRIGTSGSTVLTRAISTTTDPTVLLGTSFVVRAGLAVGTGGISLESVQQPGSYLVQQASTAVLQASSASAAYNTSATWLVKTGLTGSYTSMVPAGSTGSYLRKQNGSLVVQATDNSAQFATDATFSVRLPATPATGYYKIANNNSNLPMSLKDNALTSGTAVVQDTSSARITQEWELLLTIGGHYQVVDAADGLMLGISQASKSNGATALVASGTTSDLLWDFVPSQGHWELRNVNSGLVLGINGQAMTAGASVLQWSDNGTPDHGWNLTWAGPVVSSGTFTVTNVNSSLPLATAGGATARGTYAVQRTANGSTNQKWTFSSAGIGSEVTMTNVAANQVLAIEAQSQTPGAKALVWDTTAVSKIWRIVPQNGRYLFVNLTSNQVLGVYGASFATEGQVVQWTDSLSADHLWTLS